MSLSDIRIVEKFEKDWPLIHKGDILERYLPRYKKALWFALEVKTLWLIVCLVIGSGGSVHEEVIAIDHTSPITADRMLACIVEQDEFSSGELVDLFDIRARIRRNNDPEAACRDALIALIGKIQSDEDRWMTTICHLEGNSESVATFSKGSMA